jgi:hypothetical protein
LKLSDRPFNSCDFLKISIILNNNGSHFDFLCSGVQFGIMSEALWLQCAHCCILIRGHMIGIRCANMRWDRSEWEVLYAIVPHRFTAYPGRRCIEFQWYPVRQLSGFFYCYAQICWWPHWTVPLSIQIDFLLKILENIADIIQTKMQNSFLSDYNNSRFSLSFMPTKMSITKENLAESSDAGRFCPSTYAG